jgi:hypothetical protein
VAADIAAVFEIADDRMAAREAGALDDGQLAAPRSEICFTRAKSTS